MAPWKIASKRSHGRYLLYPSRDNFEESRKRTFERKSLFLFLHIENSSCLGACVSRLFHEREREREVGCNQPWSMYPSNSFHELLFELFWVPLKNNLFDSRVWWIMRLICRKFAVHKEWFIDLIRSEINFGSSSILWLLKKKNEETMREFIMNWFRTTAITS